MPKSSNDATEHFNLIFIITTFLFFVFELKMRFQIVQQTCETNERRPNNYMIPTRVHSNMYIQLTLAIESWKFVIDTYKACPINIGINTSIQLIYVYG